MRRLGLFGAVAVFGTACWYSKREPLVLPAAPKPLAALNTPFNDFNSAAPDTASGVLVFSTDRAAAGKHYDLVWTSIRFEGAEVRTDAPVAFEPAAMSDFDELGPTIVGDTLVFASDRPGGAGGMDIYRWDVRDQAIRRGGQAPSTKVVPLLGINTKAYEGYWTQDSENNVMLFASDRGGHGLDPYTANTVLDAPMTEPPTVTRVDALASEADDTAFHLFRDQHHDLQLLFASNRPSGADYDLYCSRYDDELGEWLRPRLLSSANSAHNDFRPIVVKGFVRDVLVFSSDRPGGKGGMDLYYSKLESPCDKNPAG